APAAFLALMAPRLRSREPWVVALLAATVALVSVPFVPAGVPVLFAAAVAIIAGVRPSTAQLAAAHAADVPDDADPAEGGGS
ncbi:MAG TPA: hypothetical protein VK662_10210, partial [Acidothermaceae bacterium]|nr:hypothetical protein [Acidothermaceae bacterium]